MAESAELLQNALNGVYDYCNLWKITVNGSCYYFTFSRDKVRKFPDFMFGKNTIDVVDDYIYLGTTFTYNGSFNKAITKQINQAIRAMFNLNLIAKELLPVLPIDIQCERFDSLVTPILLYGC